MLQVGAVLSESGERGLLPRLQPGVVELEVSERVADLLAREYSSEQMLVKRLYTFSINVYASARRPSQPSHFTPLFTHLAKEKTDRHFLD